LKEHFTNQLSDLQTIINKIKLNVSSVKDREQVLLKYRIDLDKLFNADDKEILSAECVNNSGLEKLNSLYDSYKRLSHMEIHRKVIKKPAMTKVYNVTHFSMAQYIKEEFDYMEDNLNNENWYVYKQNPNLKLKGKDIYLLTKGIDYVIYSNFDKYNKLSVYLKEIANLCVKLQIPILWILPTGLKVIQSYVTTKEIKVKPFKYRSNTFILREATNIYNKRKQVRALMPNLVHSLDAASLGLLTEMFFSDF
jgi:DNA-directed RNA polymerase